MWRDAYKRFKTKKGARVSVENLIKRVMKDNPVRHINPAVDISNAISLKYALPIGVENIDAIEGDFRLAMTEGGDYFLLFSLRWKPRIPPPAPSKCSLSL